MVKAQVATSLSVIISSNCIVVSAIMFDGATNEGVGVFCVIQCNNRIA